MSSFKLVNSQIELQNSLIEFFEKPDFWKSTLGGGAKYFIHCEVDGDQYFGLSKFCAFNTITVEDYLGGFRHEIGGGKTQKHISKLLNQKWIQLVNIDIQIKIAFENWVKSFYPNFNTGNVSIISISPLGLVTRKRTRVVTPDEFIKRQERKTLIGEIGEEIALEFENNRVRELKKVPEEHVRHISKGDVAAGFDIHTLVNKDNERFIEVKASTQDDFSFFISGNEKSVLERLQDKAFIYLVQVTSVEKREGKVYQVLRNPIKELVDSDSLKPVQFKVERRIITSENYELSEELLDELVMQNNVPL